MVPDQAFIETQRRFAERWAVLASDPVETAVLESGVLILAVVFAAIALLT